jgi:hypothetical protein
LTEYGAYELHVVVDDTPRKVVPLRIEPTAAPPRVKARKYIPNERLLELADKYPPPQSWYDEKEEFF